ncbi:MAG TPA: magnesium transporter [Parachlamydiaceae bacterium]|nr:magnesium transporter [Parachlamydiaceae bacterium]
MDRKESNRKEFDKEEFDRKELDAEEIDKENALFEEEHTAAAGNPMDFQTSNLDDELNEKLEDAFDQNGYQIILHDVTKIASEYDPIDLAHAVTRLPSESRIVVYENLPDLQSKITFMINTGKRTRSAVFAQLSDREIKSLVELMAPDDAVFVLDDLSNRRLKRILDILDPKKALRIRELLKHDRHSAGRMMTNEFFAFSMHTTIGEVAHAIRSNPGIDLTRCVFVLNDEGELVGYVPARALMVNSHHVPIRQVMQAVQHTVNADASRDEVVDIVERYKTDALAVVDHDNKLIGVIPDEDVMEALKDLADETIATIGGTSEDVGEDEPVFNRFILRAPWLLVTLCAGLVTATAMSHFHGRFWFTFVPLFVPLITGMSGNVGIQCSTILVRGMSTGQLSTGSKGEAIRKELGMGILIGLFFGVLCGFVIYCLSLFGLTQATGEPLMLGVTVFAGVLSACLTASVLGTLSPFFFVRCGIDPAVASGPIVTAFNDLLSTLMFFFVAFIVNVLFYHL